MGTQSPWVPPPLGALLKPLHLPQSSENGTGAPEKIAWVRKMGVSPRGRLPRLSDSGAWAPEEVCVGG